MMKLTITAQKSELMADLRNKTYIIGRQIESVDPKNYRQAEEMIASGDSWDEKEMAGNLNHAAGLLGAQAGEYLSMNESVSDYSLSIVVPENFNSAMIPEIKRLFHSYLVAGAISDWLFVHDKGELAKTYAAESELSARLIIQSLNTRIRPKRPE